MTAFLQQYISPALPVILWLFRGVTAGLAVWLLVRCCKSLFRGRDRENWGFVTLSNGARYELYHWENVIGRARRADIRVNFPSVSRTHAILQRDDGGTWRVDPINRSSGVLLNGKRTLVPANLNPGDSIALGGVELFFFPSEQPQHTGQPKKRPNPVGSLWLLTFIQLLLWGQFAPGFGAENIYPVSAGFFGLCGLGWALYGVSRRLHRRQFDLETLALLLATVGFAITAAWDPGALYKQLAAVAPLLCAGITTYSPLRHWQAGPGKKVGVVGIGGLGHMGIKLAHAMGAHVVAFTTSESKREAAKALGADEVVNSRNADEMAAHLKSFDFILNTVAAPHNLDDFTTLLKRDGTMTLVGAPATPHKSPEVFNLIMKRRAIAGSMIGGIPETQEMLDFCAEHGIVADIEMIRADQINEAYERMLRGDVKYRFVIDNRTLTD